MKNRRKKTSPSTFRFLLSPASWNSRSAGFLMVEALVAISVLVVGFLGIASLLSNSLSLNRVVSDNYTANYLAMEGIELVKNLIDANYIQKCAWNSGFTDGQLYEVSYDSMPQAGNCPGSALQTNSNRYLSFGPATGLYSYSGSMPTPFQRRIKITFLTPSSTAVSSEVRWTTRGGGSHSIDLEDVFWNWRP
jgi:Tfp pilus assembly protein PilV